MKRNFFYAIVITLCGTIGFSSCTKDYDDDLRIQRELIEQNTKDLRATIDAYQVLVENTIEQMDIAYKNADNLIKQEMAAEFNAAKKRLSALETALAAAESNLDDKMHILEEKKSELDEIISETKQDEEKLRVRAKEVEADIEPRLLKAFKRIRSNARNGLGIVTIQRGACGGCFNRIPAQRQMEIKMHKKIIVCEYCGRIMIDPELAGEPETV